MHFLRQTADVVVALDHMRGISADRHALDHVRIKGALGKEMIAAMIARSAGGVFGQQLLGRMLEYFHEFAPDDLPFLFRVGHAFKQV